MILSIIEKATGRVITSCHDGAPAEIPRTNIVIDKPVVGWEDPSGTYRLVERVQAVIPPARQAQKEAYDATQDKVIVDLPQKTKLLNQLDALDTKYLRHLYSAMINPNDTTAQQKIQERETAAAAIRTKLDGLS